MSVYFVSGKPGSGKSYFAARLIVRELLRSGSDRVIITNVALNIPGLIEHLQRNHPECDIDVHARVRVLDDSEAGQFWLYRPPTVREDPDVPGLRHYDWLQLQGVTQKEEKEGVRLDFSPTGGRPGVLYVIDEIHEYFNSRFWQETGRSALRYLSQHRKLGDDVWCITQSIENVDKQFRSLAQEFIYLRNHGKERVLLFSKPRVITWASYCKPATGSPGESPLEMGSFKIDVKGLANVYYTAKGVGVAGTLADTKDGNKKGLHWSVLVGAAAVFLLLIWKAPAMVGQYFTGKWFGKQPATASASGVVERPPDPGPAPAFVPSNAPPFAGVMSAVVHPRQAPAGASPGAELSAPGGRAVAGPEVWLTGLAFSGGQAQVWLSDGRTYTSADRELTFIGRNFVVIDRVVYRMQPPSSAPVPGKSS